MSRLHALLTKRVRVVAGIMSGTSADGVDVAVARLEGSGPDLNIEAIGHLHVDYAREFRDVVLEHALDRGVTMRSTSQLNVALAHVYADAVRKCLDHLQMTPADLDLVGSHGQTVHHVPVPADMAGHVVTSTLQLGDPTVLANLIGTPVVGDFRLPDMALGGQGAPLVPYFDYVAFSDPANYRVLLNLGGIANVTFLRPGGSSDQVIAFDSGPANMLVDFLCERLFAVPMDRDGLIARSATADQAIVEELMQHEYFHRPPPKTTGRELFDDRFASAICKRFESQFGPESDWTDRDKRIVIASVTALTAQTVAAAVTTWNPIDRRPDVVISAGGGTLNPTLISMIEAALVNVPVRPIDDFGIGSDQKEALCFAVLAHEFMNETPTGMPSVTGARAAGILGSLALPSRDAEG